eukprot:2113572-Amphidinium_carterae.1
MALGLDGDRVSQSDDALRFVRNLGGLSDSHVAYRIADIRGRLSYRKGAQTMLRSHKTNQKIYQMHRTSEELVPGGVQLAKKCSKCGKC